MTSIFAFLTLAMISQNVFLVSVKAFFQGGAVDDDPFKLEQFIV